jgi:puromycin-sensitive aminopeptidase
MTAKAYRLPLSVLPQKYRIEISTELARPDFDGTLEVDLELREATRQVEMHARGLTLSGAVLIRGETTQTLSIQTESGTEVVRFVSAEPLSPGRAQLRVRFAGRLSESMHGLYLAKDGQEEALCTQCEATDARAIFPCFDEPAFKAQFQWTVHTKGQVVVLANGALESRTETADGHTWRFLPTDIISSYLVALAIGPFESSDELRAGNIPSRVWAMAGKQSQTEFAAKYTRDLLPWYETYFGVPYPYGKYDQVAVPGFDAGAMENVGLVLFRQNLLLQETGSASWNQEKLIAKVIAHELAHMWFGNWVTMAWWDDLWLNEAFAEWFAHKAVDFLSPDYRVWDDFMEDKIRAQLDDALETTHAIYTAVETPSQAIEMFDVITYQKGCAVMRMIEAHFGEKAFQSAIQTYMRRFARRNAQGADLWATLAESTQANVHQLVTTWIEQPGFPVVQIRLEEAEQGHRLVLQQRRFFSDPRAAHQDNDQLWHLPIRLRYQDDSGVKWHTFEMTTREHEANLPSAGKIDWIQANDRETGFYRVHMSDELFERMLPVASSVLESSELSGLVEDTWALVRNGTVSPDRFFPLLETCAQSVSHTVLKTVSGHFENLDSLLHDAAAPQPYENFHKKARSAWMPHIEALGVEPQASEDNPTGERRALALSVLGHIAEDAITVAQARTYARREEADPRSVDPNLAGTWISIAAHFGDATDYESWLRIYRDRKAARRPPQECLRYLYSLSQFRLPELTRRTLDELTGDIIPQEAFGSVLSQLLGRRHSQLMAWDFLRDHWDQVRDQVGDMGVSRVVASLGALPPDRINEVEGFFRAHEPRGAERALARALERMRQYAELKDRLLPALLKRYG